MLGNKEFIEQSKQIVHDYAIEQLEHKQDKHNNLIERTYNLERRADISEEKIRVANHRIDDLERKGD